MDSSSNPAIWQVFSHSLDHLWPAIPRGQSTGNEPYRNGWAGTPEAPLERPKRPAAASGGAAAPLPSALSVWEASS